MLRTAMLHKFLLVSLFVVMTASQPGSVSAGINVWTSNGSEGGHIGALAIDLATPTVPSAGTYGGVFKSTSGSATGLTATLTSRWSTFFGGYGHTNGVQSRVDSSGNVWVAFTTTAADMPTTANAFDPTHNGNEDIVIAKFSAEGDLLYSTYLGGAYDDVVSSIALDNDDHIYLTGHTFSADFPTTANALSRVLQGGRDAIVIKLDATGQLVYSTMLGGNSWDYGFTIAVDLQNDIYVGGFTHGSFPVTPDVAQFNFGGAGDGFVAKLHTMPVSTTLVFATYLGGNSWEAVAALTVDENGYMYLAMGTHSTDFPTTPGAFDRVCNNCATNIKTDGALVKLSPDASQLIYSTLFGSNTATTGSLVFSGIAIDDVGNAYVTGITTYTDMPVTPDAVQPAYGGGNYDGLLVKINASGSQLLYSTYFGGSGDDRVSTYDALARDEQGNLYFAGRTASSNLPLLNPIQSSLSGGYDAYFASFDAENHLRLSTYWGGSQDEGVSPRVTVDTQGNVYLAGGTVSPDFPTTPNAFDPTINGTDYNGFVSKFTIANNPLGTWHVATNGSDVTGTGSEAKPFATIQHGIDTATNGDTVLVHPSVYRENINFNGKNITVGSLFVTTGDEDYILQTVIDGNRNGHVVTFANGETATAKLNGVTITNGYAHGVPAPGTHGGGVFCNYSSPTLMHLRVTFNEATNEGGGLYFENCSPTVQDVTVTNNLAGSGGGGITYSGGSVSLENVVVTHNSARLAGSGIQFYHAEGTIKNALIADNFAAGQGGGLHFDGCSPSFINVTVVGNWTTGHGGGLNVSYMSQPTLVNSIVWGNTPEQIYFDTQWPGEAVTIEYSDIQDGLAGIVTNGQGPVYWGNGNLDASPRFVDVGLGNYHLANDSPGISAGKAAGAPGTDIEGNLRPGPAGSNPDMGAYENPIGQPSSMVYLPLLLRADSPLTSTEQVYFSAGDILYRINVDGSNRTDVAHGVAGGEHLAADQIHHKVYASRWDAPAQILVYDVYGSGNIEVFADGPGYGGQGLAIDPVSSDLYLGLYYAGVYVKNMTSGSAWRQLVTSSSLYPLLGQRGQLQIDPVNRHIYFRTAFNGECGECRYIWRVNFDGTHLIKFIPANGGDALALDLTNQRMYFSDVPGNYTIKRANLDGSQVETMLTVPVPYRFARSIALDVAHQKMYLSLYDEDNNYTGRAIARANMDGSEFEILHVVTGNTQSDVNGGLTLYSIVEQR